MKGPNLWNLHFEIAMTTFEMCNMQMKRTQSEAEAEGKEASASAT